MNLENVKDWIKSLPEFLSEYADHFHRSETRHSVGIYVRGLLAEISRKNGWQLAEKMGLETPRPLQRVLNEAHWEANEVCVQMRAEIKQEMGYQPGVGVIDESGFLKKGNKSAGVARQYCGRVGKVENCQVGVFLGYVTPHGAAFLDRELYLPRSWCDDRERCQEAKIPEGVSFQTKPELAQAMLERTWQEEIPMKWVTGDTVYGNSPTLRAAIAQQGCYYVLGIGQQHHLVWSQTGERLPVIEIVDRLSDWQRLIFHLSDDGPRAYDWVATRVAIEGDEIGQQWLLCRRTLDPSPEVSLFLSNGSADTPLTDLASVASARHPIEQLIQEGKSELGLADYEVRSWPGWYRHMTLCFLAHTWLALTRHQQRKKKETLLFGVATL